MDKVKARKVQDMLKLVSFYQWIDELEDEGTKLPRDILPTVGEYRSVVSAVEKAVSQLPALAQSVVRQRYMNLEADFILDYQVYTALQIHESTYIKHRDLAFEKLAEALLPEMVCEMA